MQYWHASFVTNTVGIGLLIIGAPGVGKTEFCYHLIKYSNYYLVADDLVKVIKTNNAYEGFLCNDQYCGVMHHKKRGLIQVKKALKQGVISHVLYLYCQTKDISYCEKAQTLSLPLIDMNVSGKTWSECERRLQNMLG